MVIVAQLISSEVSDVTLLDYDEVIKKGIHSVL